MLDLTNDNPTTAKLHLISFIAKIQTQALEDHEVSRAGKPSGWDICNKHCLDWRKGHERMASGLYNKLRWGMLIAEGRTDEAARW